MNTDDKLNFLKDLYNVNRRFQRNLRTCQEENPLTSALLSEQKAASEDSNPLPLL